MMQASEGTRALRKTDFHPLFQLPLPDGEKETEQPTNEALALLVQTPHVTGKAALEPPTSGVHSIVTCIAGI